MKFLFRLAVPEGYRYGYTYSRCGGSEYTYARKIIWLMHISEAEQQNFLKKLKFSMKTLYKVYKILIKIK